MKTKGFQLPDNMAKFIENEALKQEISEAEFVRVIIRSYMDKLKIKNDEDKNVK